MIAPLIEPIRSIRPRGEFSMNLRFYFDDTLEQWIVEGKVEGHRFKETARGRDEALVKLMRRYGLLKEGMWKQGEGSLG